MTDARIAYRRWKNRVGLSLMALAVALCLVPVVSVVFTVIANGASALRWRLLTHLPAPVGESGGIANAIIGSALLLVIAATGSVPVGIALGLYLVQRRQRPLARVARLVLDVISGIPAIVVGVFIYTIIVLPMHHFSMLAGGLALGMIMLPVFARTSEEALRGIPTTVHEGGLALGLPRRRVILRLVLRAAMPAVLTGLFLAVARVAGEAAPLMFTSLSDTDWPRSPLGPVASLPVLLYTYAISPFDEWHRQAWAAALVLMAMILTFRLVTQAYGRWRYGRKAAP
jgi:phosphate transport system permease protein